MIKEDLRKWFKEKWVRFDTKGDIKGECARDEGEGKPKCLPMAKAQALGKKARAIAAKRKRRKDPVADRKGKGGKPINVRTESFEQNQIKEDGFAFDPEKGRVYVSDTGAVFSKGKKVKRSKYLLMKGKIEGKPTESPEPTQNKPTTEENHDPHELEVARKMLTGEQPDKGNVGGNLTAKQLIAMHKAMHEPANDPDKKKAEVIPFRKPVKPVKEEYLEEKNVPTNPKLWSQAKALAKKKFDVYSSAYANGWASKWYKSKGGDWKTLKEDRREQSKTFFMESLGYELVEKKVEKDHEKEMARTQLKTATNAIQRLMKRIGSGEGQLEAWVQSKITKAVDYIDSVADYMDNNDKEIKEAIELANQAREYIGEQDK